MTGRRGTNGRPRGQGQGQGKGRSGATLRAPQEGMFRDILMAPDRDSIPEARPLVSLSGDEPADFMSEVRTRRVDEIALVRRGVDHGRVVELEREGLVGPRPRRRRRDTIEFERWIAGSPIFLPAAADGVRPNLLANDPMQLLERLRQPGGLRGYLAAKAPALTPQFRVGEDVPLFDPQRDIERVLVHAEAGPELWLKTGRLSTHAEDASLRMRASFGAEGADDASSDEPRHRLVGDLARVLFPGARAIAGLDDVNAKLERFAGAPTFGTQHIAYWNAPGGGARFHHDAFDVADGQRQQCGVLYTQLTGRTLWLALSIEDMGERMREIIQWVEAGDMPWVREDCGASWSSMRELAARRDTALRELAQPNCGVFAPLVDRPEFTASLTDAGHALVLRPGDVLILPNHGLDRTAMHSVFCTSKEAGYAVSIALRTDAGEGPPSS